MLKRRLYLQIYAIIIVSLVAVFITFGIVGQFFDRDDRNANMLELVGKLTFLALPNKEAPIAEQGAGVTRLSEELGVTLSLFDNNRQIIASSGTPLALPANLKTRKKWQRFDRGQLWVLHLPDGRWLAAKLDKRRPPPPIIRLLFFLAGISVAVALVAYPFVRKLTGRLERLQACVEQMGAGDLSIRVDIEGKDEIASLAKSFNDTAGKIETLLASHRLLLANASHELRTPLARIRLGVEMLNGSADQKRQQDLQNDIKELDDLIDEILLMSRLDAGADITAKDDVDIVALVAEECARFVNCTFEGKAPTILGDEKLLRRLVRNLLHNAQIHGKPPIDVRLKHNGSDIVLTVADRGSGFDQIDHESAFRPFQRASDRQNIRGYGLGLALVRQIAEAHNGSAEIVPKKEMPSAVRITFGTWNRKNLNDLAIVKP